MAASSLAEEGRKQEAVNILARAESLINTKAMPYAMTSRNGHNQIGMLYLEAAYKAGFTDLAGKVKAALVKDFKDQLKYYSYLREFKEEYYYPLATEEKEAQDYLNYINQFEQQYEGKKPVTLEIPARRDSVDTSQRR
jgi:hypothetical protein